MLHHPDRKRYQALLSAWLVLALTVFQPWQVFLLESAAYAQTSDFLSRLQGCLDRYYTANVPLILDMQFNQPSYAAGDTAWFTMRLTTEREGLPVAGRQVMRVELAARTGEVVSRHRILMNNGSASSQIVVPAGLQSGMYTVIAWTDWMRNDDNGLFCYKDLLVQGEKQVTRGPMMLQAYPEGGVLVRGVKNTVVVTGVPLATVTLEAGKLDMLSLTLDELGYGQFSFTPTQEIPYTLTEGKQVVKLKEGEDGIAMSLRCSDSLQTLSLVLRSSQPRDGCHLAMISRGKVVYSALVGFQNDSALVSIPRKILPEELILAAVFDSHNEVLCQRLLVANTQEQGVTLSAAKQPVHPREAVSISVATDGLNGMPLMVRVYADDLFSNADNGHAPFLSAGRLPFGALDFKISNGWALEEWNRFLGTQQWKRFQWSDVWSGSRERQYPFARYLKFVGQVTLPNQVAAFDSVRVTFFLRNEARIYEQYVDSNGRFDLELFFDFDGEEEVIYTVDQKGRIIPEATIMMDAGEEPVFKFESPLQSEAEGKYAMFAQVRRDIDAAYRNYKAIAVDSPGADDNDRVKDELFAADVTVRLDNYVLFPTMEETLREIVPRLQHRWRSKHHTVTVALSEPEVLAKSDPLYFIDGVLTDDTDYFMSLDPRKVATIKVISSQRKLQAMGILGRNGVVLVSTTIPDNQLRVPPTRKHFSAIGFTRPIQFNNVPEMSIRTPMLRSTAYFNPALKVDGGGTASFEVVAPDNTGRFRVEVTGMSKTGMLRRAVNYLCSMPPASTH